MPWPSILQSVRDRFRSVPGEHVPIRQHQAGVIPYAVVSGVPTFLLITTRRTGRWVFPKGGLMDGLEPWDSAAQEALEEAGVEGSVSREPIGTYRTWKVRGLRRRAVEVTVYPLRVERQHERWLEFGQRHRHWAVAREARRLISDKALVPMIDAVAAKVRGENAAAAATAPEPTVRQRSA